MIATSKRWREFFSAMGGNLEEAEDFRRLLCVTIEIDQLQCVNC